jgi:heme-degrading monooxygenase HmoA
VTIVEFESMEGQLVWRNNAEHSEARMKGRTTFYDEYKVQVCKVLREHIASD